jgi:uncharacterized membrane protein
MTTAQQTDERIETYLAQLEGKLSGLLPADRQDILREIRAHILDSCAGASNYDTAVERVLRLLGSPKELASRYSAESLLTRASRSFSPVLLLRTCWRWAQLGIKGTLAFLLALFGYTTAAALVAAVFLKPFMPGRVGLWIGPEGLNVGVPAHPELMHELLGNYFVPVIAAIAFLIAIGTTQGLRWMIRKRTSETAFALARRTASA